MRKKDDRQHINPYSTILPHTRERKKKKEKEITRESRQMGWLSQILEK